MGGEVKKVEQAKILVVEDENIVAMDIQNSLKSLGYAVPAVVSSGEDAIKTAADTYPDLVLMDIVLEGRMDGVQAAEQIHGRFNIPVVYLTAYGDEKMLQRAKMTEPFGYIIKPFKQRELRSSIEVALYKSQTQSKLRKSKESLATALKSIRDGLIITDMKGLVTFMNPGAEALTGCKQEDALGKDLTEVFNIVDEKTRTPAGNLTAKVLQESVIVGVENHALLIAKAKTETPILYGAAPIKDDKGNITGSVLVFRDITERKKAEEELQESKSHFQTLFNVMVDPVVIVGGEGKILEITNRVQEVTGFKREELLGKNFHKIKILTAKSEVIVTKNLVKRMMGAKITPYEVEIITKDRKKIVVEANAAKIKYRGKPTVMAVFRDLSGRKKAQGELQRTLEKLRKALGATIQALALTVEVRDAYTAGHQRRVTNLARTIATEMQLSKRHIDGIRMAGAIHDLGKIGVPAEILNKPIPLADIEFALIKIHPLVGYNILKQMKFPWPVAKIVLQHHERMDGTGYPHGLSGEDILLEARILGVADVVEAMCSHRPYRPALGIDKALEEISKNKGILYDPQVVDTCLKLFTDKGFKFK